MAVAIGQNLGQNLGNIVKEPGSLAAVVDVDVAYDAVYFLDTLAVADPMNGLLTSTALLRSINSWRTGYCCLNLEDCPLTVLKYRVTGRLIRLRQLIPVA